MSGYNNTLIFIEKSSDLPGPTIWLTAGIHGDEPDGTVVIYEIFKRLKTYPLLRGAVKAFPLLNPEGTKQKTREIPETKEDLNRAFPGNMRGSFAQKIAAYIFTEIIKTKPAAVFDFHNDWKNSIPYILFDPPILYAHKKAYQIIEPLAHTSGFPVIKERKKDIKEFRKSLSGSLLYSGIPACTIELGGASKIKKGNSNKGVQAIWNMLAQLKMTKLDVKKKIFIIPLPYKNKTLYYSDIPKSKTTGRVHFFIQPGKSIKKGALIAKIAHPKGSIEKITARHPGIVLGYTDDIYISPGSLLAAFGIIKK